MDKIIAHFLDMHRWQKALLTLSVALFGTGTAHQMTTYFGATPPVATAPSNVQNQPPAPEPTLGEKLSPWAMRVGASFIAGFLLGFALRVFVRITMTILLVGVIVMVLLSRFNVVNVDF